MLVRMKRNRHFVVRSTVSLALVCAVVMVALAQEAPKSSQSTARGYPDLVGGLKAVEGCIGVETARTQGGKNVIFAWFENKDAVKRWYYSDTHRGAMGMFFPEAEPAEPLKDIPDGAGPILAIASITFSDKDKMKESAMPISQISIELYQPLSGGLYIGSRFAPEGLKVPKMKDYTPKK